MNKEQYELEISKQYLTSLGLVIIGLLTLIGGAVGEINMVGNLGVGILGFGVIKMGLTAWKNINLRV